MHIEEIELPGPRVITAEAHGDGRGWLSEAYNAKRLVEHGIDDAFVEDGHTFLAKSGSVWGLHYQAPPFAQAKIVRVIRGGVLYVIVDARVGSPTFGRHAGVLLSYGNQKQLYAPEGFLHGFVTTTPDVDIVYKASSCNSPEHEGAVAWNDADLGIDWRIVARNAIVSEKDARARSWAEFESPFRYTPV